MNKKIKCLVALSILLLVALAAAGCGSAQQAAPASNSADSARNTDAGQNMASAMPVEDPKIFVKDMQLTLGIISEQSRLNNLDGAKKAAASMMALQAKLAVHITDAKQEKLRNGILALQAEVEKPGPSQSAIDKQVEVVKGLLNDISGPVQNHVHH